MSFLHFRIYRQKSGTEGSGKLLVEHSLLFVNGIAGIGKSEFAKAFAQKNKKKYTNIIYLHYSGSLKKDIAGLVFADDTLEMTEEELFHRHYKMFQKLHIDSLLIIDNFNVLPKDDGFFRELIKNDFQILTTTRCKITNFASMEIKELDNQKELAGFILPLLPFCQIRVGYRSCYYQRSQESYFDRLHGSPYS